MIKDEIYVRVHKSSELNCKTNQSSLRDFESLG